MRTKRVQPARGKAPATEPGESSTTPGAGGGDGDTAGELTLFREALDRFVRPLKEDVTDFEATILTSFLKQADGLQSSVAIMNAFLMPVRDILGRDLLNIFLSLCLLSQAR